jgi:hydroxymethylpyrimidine/phosphomethylpyrimidine kinase
VVEQIQAVISDIPPAAAKTGALGNAAIVEAIAELAKSFTFPLVVDPVMISKHGARLISREAEGALKQMLFPHAFLVTPNVPEAEALTGMTIRDQSDMRLAAKRIRDFGCKAALVKGGHGRGEPIDILSAPGLTEDSSECFSGRRINTRHSHGTGCTYSAAITAGLALGHDLRQSILAAKSFIQSAIETAPALGGGYGPVNHFVKLTRT